MTSTILALILLAIVTQISCLSLPNEPYTPNELFHYSPYGFGYDVEDNHGNKQWRQEQSYKPDEVHGSYGYRDNNGIWREVTYVADKNGFRANVKTNEPGIHTQKEPASVKYESFHTGPSAQPNKHVSALPPFYRAPVKYNDQ